jgi:hypothetical protein
LSDNKQIADLLEKYVETPLTEATCLEMDLESLELSHQHFLGDAIRLSNSGEYFISTDDIRELEKAGLRLVGLDNWIQPINMMMVDRSFMPEFIPFERWYKNQFFSGFTIHQRGLVITLLVRSVFLLHPVPPLNQYLYY